MKLVLLVESNAEDRTRFGNWLEDAGYSLMDCPGPRREDFTCLGVRGKRCALVEIADMAILDGRVLQSGTDMKGASRLVHYYLRSGKPVLILVDGDAGPSFENDGIATANRHDRRRMLATVAELLDSRCLAS